MWGRGVFGLSAVATMTIAQDNKSGEQKTNSETRDLTRENMVQRGMRAKGDFSRVNSSRYRLLQVQAISRHGMRTPVTAIPHIRNVTWNCVPDEQDQHVRVATSLEFETEEGELRQKFRTEYGERGKGLKGTCTKGQLTPEGTRQMMEVGRMYRERYVNQLGFLPSDIAPGVMYVRSTDVPRTILSAQSIMTGLYPSPSPSSPPLVIHSIYENDENMYPRGGCKQLKKYQHLSKEVTESEETKAIMNQLRAMTGYSSSPSLIGMHNTIESLVLHHDTHLEDMREDMLLSPSKLSCEEPTPLKGGKENIIPKDEFHTLPCGIVEALRMKVGESMGAKYNDPQHAIVARLAIGRFLYDLKQETERAVAFYSKREQKASPTSLLNEFSSAPPKMLLYVGHDTTIGPLLGSLGVFDGFNPPLGSQLIIELYGEEEQNAPQYSNFYVKLIYNGKVVPLSQTHRLGEERRKEEREREGERGEEGLVSLEFFMDLCEKMSISQESYVVVCDEKE